MRKKNNYILFIIVVLLICGFFLFKIRPQNEVWYGTPTKISLSGDFRFNRTDENGNLIRSEHWFWAIPKDLHDTNEIDHIYDLLQNNTRGIYKITGLRDPDDCHYYEAGPMIGTCIKSLIINSIIRIN
jgi:hypothetical protein